MFFGKRDLVTKLSLLRHTAVVFMAVLFGTYHTRLLMISVPFGTRDLDASGIFHIILTVQYWHYCAVHCHCRMNLPVCPLRLLMAVFTAISTGNL